MRARPARRPNASYLFEVEGVVSRRRSDVLRAPLLAFTRPNAFRVLRRRAPNID